MGTVKRQQTICLASSSSGSDSQDDVDEFFPSCSTTGTDQPAQKRAKKQIITPILAATLDRTKICDRNATMVLVSTAKSLGHDVSD